MRPDLPDLRRRRHCLEGPTARNRRLNSDLRLRRVCQQLNLRARGVHLLVVPSIFGSSRRVCIMWKDRRTSHMEPCVAWCAAAARPAARVRGAVDLPIRPYGRPEHGVRLRAILHSHHPFRVVTKPGLLRPGLAALILWTRCGARSSRTSPSTRTGFSSKRSQASIEWARRVVRRSCVASRRAVCRSVWAVAG